MIDPEEGRVEYVVLSFGGFLGMGEKLLAVPMQALTLMPDEHKFLLNESKERLKNAPGFDKNNWPDRHNHACGDKIYDYYSYVPYWRQRLKGLELESGSEITR